jgi:hypothetical protein
MKPTTLPKGHKDEIKLNEKLSGADSNEWVDKRKKITELKDILKKQTIKRITTAFDMSKFWEECYEHDRKAMIECASEDEIDCWSLDLINKWSETISILINKWDIKIDDEGVSFGGLKTANENVQEKMILDIYGGRHTPILSDQWYNYDGEALEHAVVFKNNLDAYGDQFGDFVLWSKDQLNTMCARIKENFEDVSSDAHAMYILQMIHTDLIWEMWMKDVSWDNERSYLSFGVGVYERSVLETSENLPCKLFLVKNI